MPRVICALPNASNEISGVKFHKLEDGRLISDEIDDEKAARFASIPGYEVDDDNEPPEVPTAEPAPRLTKAQQKAQAKAEAEAKAKAEAAAAEQGGADDNDAGGAEKTEEVF